MDIKKRNASINGFKAPSRSPKVLIVSLKAGGVGLNVSRVRMYSGMYNANNTSDAAHGRKSCLYGKLSL